MKTKTPAKKKSPTSRTDKAVGSGPLVSPASLTVAQLLSYAKKHGIERDEVYDWRAPSHWPKDRCYRYEYDEEFAQRVRTMMANNGDEARRDEQS